MHAKGHFGLTLFILSLIGLPIGFGPENLMIFIIFLSAILSSLPDIDIKIGISHRTVTHSLLFAIIIGILFGILLGYSSGLLYGFLGFIAGFLAIVIHMLGDLMTFQKFNPLWPFKQNYLSYGLFEAKSKAANNIFFVLGWIMFFVYIFIS
ncbi:MAG: hypothetical protein BV457_06035 [Thermoplasmata archaeon M9B1D]|nr:MAG: hypothetical protein BV457_06035 [Thermoplasmata archaeon M9B1D]PNX50364.1 MAG: hypothetical protein BV456_06920 [Thermoplasmata archaeon M8B2D]